ncbi:hypothetical protein, partial [Sphingomonas bacterium]|uniref:hypothetical protein n=1 Tax=Sphingomonas bacterium TaxID=1895847 RepID=UPI001575AFA5
RSAAGPRPVSIPGVSPAGIAILNRLQAQRDPTLAQLAGQQRAVMTQIVTEIAGATVNVEKFTALLKQNEGLQAQMRTRADDRVIAALRALPPGDRAAFLRGVTGASAAQAQRR